MFFLYEIRNYIKLSKIKIESFSSVSAMPQLCPLLLPLHTTAQDRGSLKGLLPVGTPTNRASLPAFCRQYCCSSAAAWDTLILSTLASSFSCSTSRRMLDKLELEVMLVKKNCFKGENSVRKKRKSPVKCLSAAADSTNGQQCAR